MFSRWGAFVYRFRRPFVVGSVALALVMGFFGLGASSHLSSGGWLDTTSESAKVDLRLASEFGGGKSNIIALFRSSVSSDATSPAFQAAIGQTLAPLAGDPDVAGIVGYAQTKDSRFISSTGSTAGSATYVVIQLNATDEQSVDLVDGIRAKLSAPAGFTYQLTGYGPITKDAAGPVREGPGPGRDVSLPIVALILILVFASLVAAAMPLLVAGLAIPTTLGLIYFVSRQIEMSVYVINIATMLGLALAIDYSLFIVSRFREELARGRTVGEAVEKAVATSGKAVAFSGFAVAIGLSGLLLFKSSAISSIGVAGSLVVIGTPGLRPDLPAGHPGHARAAGQLAQPGWPLPAARLAPERPAAIAGSGSPASSCAGRCTCWSPSWPSCSWSARRSSGWSRACPTRRSTRRHGEPRCLHRPPDGVRRPARRRRSSSWPRPGRPDLGRPTPRPWPPMPRAGRPATASPRREPVLADRPDQRRALTPEQVGAALCPARGAAGRRWPVPRSRRSRPPTSGAATVRLNAISPLDPASPQATSIIPRSGPSRRATGSRPGRRRVRHRPRLPGRPGRPDALRHRA
jgi:hypothetical protein